MMVRPRLRRIAATLVACLVAVVATACGSSSSTKKDVIARGNAICSSAVNSVRAVVPPAKGAGSGTALAGYFRQLEPIVAKEVTQLRKLPRPSTDRAVLNRYIDSVTKAGNVYKQLVSAAERNDIPGVAKHLSALRASPAQSLAQRYGMSKCAAAAGAAAP
ncbi:MAG: hypothetical protein M3070_08685 [Actinomycetota bacterium]|nr:hypothetical protein [Actinomycetota bacterium]